MNLEEMKSILGSDFSSVESIFESKYNENKLEIDNLDKQLDAYEVELRNLFDSFGLTNCIDNMNELDRLNNKYLELTKLEEENELLTVQKAEIIKKLSNVVKENNALKYDIGWSQIQQTMDEYRAQITEIDEKIIANKIEINTRETIDKQINELHDGITQSMIALDEDQKSLVDAIYIKAAKTKRVMRSLEADNNKIIENFPNILEKGNNLTDEIREIDTTDIISNMNNSINDVDSMDIFDDTPELDEKNDEIRDVDTSDIIDGMNISIKEVRNDNIPIEENIEKPKFSLKSGLNKIKKVLKITGFKAKYITQKINEKHFTIKAGTYEDLELEESINRGL